MSSKTLRAGLSLVLAAMTLAGCASYSGLTTEGKSLDAKTLKAGQSLSGVTPVSYTHLTLPTKRIV